MRVITNDKAREGKRTWHRKLLAEHLKFSRQINDPAEIWADSKCSWGCMMMSFTHGLCLYMCEVTYDIKNKRWDHLIIYELKKRCKKKMEPVHVLLY